MYLAMNGLVAVGRLGAADGVDQRHAVVGQQVAHLAEVGGVVVDADVLEHADRDDAVEAARRPCGSP